MTLLKITTAILTVVITFEIKSFKIFLKNLFFLFAITCIFGGFVLATYLIIDKDIMIYTNGIIYFEVSMTFLVVCSVISYLIITLITNYTDKKSPKSKEYSVTVENKGKSITCPALMDTGNGLSEPFSGYPVIIADESIFKKIYCEENIRLIPVVTVTEETLIRSFRPDKVTIGSYSTNNVYIGESLTSLDEYKIILNISLEGAIQNEENNIDNKKALHKVI